MSQIKSKTYFDYVPWLAIVFVVPAPSRTSNKLP